MPNLIWFEWEKCPDGYTIEELRAEYLTFERDGTGQPTKSAPAWVIETSVWKETDERLFTPDIEFDDFPILMVVPKSERVVQSQTLIEESPGAFMMFADCAKSLEKTLLFVEQFGYPHIAVLGPDPVDRLGRRLSVTRLPLGNYSVDQFSIEADEMAKIVQLWEEAKLNGSYWDLLYDLNEHERETTRKEDDAIRANLRENRADRAQPPQFSITPRSLEDALWLQFKIAVSDNTQMQQCTECPTWFAYGAGTGRRKSALYCSPKCSKTAYRRRKAESQ